MKTNRTTKRAAPVLRDSNGNIIPQEEWMQWLDQHIINNPLGVQAEAAQLVDEFTTWVEGRNNNG